MSKSEDLTLDLFDVFVEFIAENIPYYKDKKTALKNIVLGHYKYGTIDFEFDSKGLVYVVRYNVRVDTVDVLDLCIRRDCRKRSLVKYIILKNWFRFPITKKICFKRKHKYPEKESKEYIVSQLLKGRI